MSQILIVEDDQDIGDILDHELQKEGYSTYRAYSGTEAKLVLEHVTPDLILMDLMIPGIPGEELIKFTKDIPVIAVSAKTSVDDKVYMLTNGCVDYITKPFDLKELKARVAVHIKNNQVTKDSDDSIITCGDLTIDKENFTIYCKGELIKFTRTEYAIMAVLIENKTKVISKSILLERIYDITPDCMDSSIKVHISNIRRKLRTISDKEYIESVWGIGFKIIE